MKKLIAVILSLVFVVLSLTGCGIEAKATNLMQGISANKVEANDNINSKAITEFALNLYKNSKKEGKNTLVSPLSVLYALAMTQNGANAETLSQMEKTLGIKREELNSSLHTYLNNLPNTDEYKLSIANSIWFRDDESLKVKKDFLQLNADYYNADIYKAPFNESTLADINKWGKDKTDGYINEILDKIPNDAVMYLINALVFDAEWQETYKKSQVRNGIFNLEKGRKINAEFMYSEEYTYIEDENTKGFIKNYKDNKYAFVALLPDEALTIDEYIKTLNGEKIEKLISNKKHNLVKASIPKFETEFEAEMSETLKKMGMKNAFDSAKADFSNLATSSEGNIYINRILHKTYISVAEQGTQAGAATVVEVNAESALIDENEKTVYLDRPFVYMLIDLENNIPFFIGNLNIIE